MVVPIIIRRDIEDLHSDSPQGGGGGTLDFSNYRSPPKNTRNFKHPKIFEILATPKNIPNLYLDLKKTHKMHRNDP